MGSNRSDQIAMRLIAPIGMKELRDLHEKVAPSYELKEDGFTLGSGFFDRNANPVIGMAGRAALEVFTLIDKSWRDPEQQFEAGLALSRHFEQEAKSAGYVQLFAAIPSEIEKSFGRRMYREGWRKNLWPVFSKDIA